MEMLSADRTATNAIAAIAPRLQHHKWNKIHHDAATFTSKMDDTLLRVPGTCLFTFLGVVGNTLQKRNMIQIKHLQVILLWLPSTTNPFINKNIQKNIITTSMVLWEHQPTC